LVLEQLVGLLACQIFAHFTVWIVKVTPETSAGRTKHHAGGCFATIDPVRTIGALLDPVAYMCWGIGISKGEINRVFWLIIVKSAHFIGACGYTQLAADALLVILGNNPIITLCDSFGGADSHAGRSIAVLAADRYVIHRETLFIGPAWRINKVSANTLDSIPPYIIRQIVLRLASNGTGEATDASFCVNYHSIAHKLPPQTFSTWQRQSYQDS
jgi:hypothetical protein